MQPGPGAPEGRWGCPLMPHLKASNSEAAGVVGRGPHVHQEGAVGDVLLVELHRDLVVAWKERERDGVGPGAFPNGRGLGGGGGGGTWLLSHVGDPAGAVFVVVEGDLRPARPLHSDGQTPGPGLPGPDVEVGWRRQETLTQEISPHTSVERGGSENICEVIIRHGGVPGSPACAPFSPGPATRTLEAPPSPSGPTVNWKGLPSTCSPLYLTLTLCTPISVGTKRTQ